MEASITIVATPVDTVWGDMPAHVARPATPRPATDVELLAGYLTPVRAPKKLEVPPAPKKARKSHNPFEILNVE